MTSEPLHVLVSTSSFGEVSRRPLELLEERGLRVRRNPHGRQLKPEEAIELLEGIDGLVAGTEKLTRDVLARAPRLKVISRVGTGMDNVDIEAARERGIAVFNTPDVHVDAVAELALGGMLAVLRRMAACDRAVRAGAWKKPMGSLLRGKTVGIVGMGRVGKALVGLLRPFDVRVLAADPALDAEFAAAHGVEGVALDALLEQSDVVSLNLSFSSSARHLIGRAELARLKPTAVLVNCARGGLVDEAALVEHLREHPEAGAYLDTFEIEPYRGPLVELDNVLLTAHVGSYARESRERMETEAVLNLLKGLEARGLA